LVGAGVADGVVVPVLPPKLPKRLAAGFGAAAFVFNCPSPAEGALVTSLSFGAPKRPVVVEVLGGAPKGLAGLGASVVVGLLPNNPIDGLLMPGVEALFVIVVEGVAPNNELPAAFPPNPPKVGF